MEFLKQYEILYKKARTDLKVAKILLENLEKLSNFINTQISKEKDENR